MGCRVIRGVPERDRECPSKGAAGEQVPEAEEACGPGARSPRVRPHQKLGELPDGARPTNTVTSAPGHQRPPFWPPEL